MYGNVIATTRDANAAIVGFFGSRVDAPLFFAGHFLLDGHVKIIFC